MPTKKLQRREGKLKVWAVVDTTEKARRIFFGQEGDYHIFKTKKEADTWIEKQFFPARDMGWRARPIIIIY